MTDRPTLDDLIFSARSIPAALHAVPRGEAAFTIPCDKCKGTGEVQTWNIRRCPKCHGYKVLPVGILRGEEQQRRHRLFEGMHVSIDSWELAERSEEKT